MDPTSETSFDGAAAMFLEHASSLRGYVRYSVSRRNLEPYLPPKRALRVLDIGGGSGIDTAWLAMKGYHVTMVEPSLEQCNNARSRFNFFLQGPERSRIRLVHGTLSDLSDHKPYDLIIMHAVAMYQPDPSAFIITASVLLKRGGVLSLMEKGYYSAEMQAIARQDFDGFQALQTGGPALNAMGLERHAFRPDELQIILQKAGLNTERWSGVRVLSDRLDVPIADIDQGDLAAIVDAEYEQGSAEAIRATGQLLHFIARK